jgi:ABC-2 type transport system ATP-binding protein
MCDRIGIIQNGRLIDVQLVQELVHGAAEMTYELEVVPADQALNLIDVHYPNVRANRSRNGITVELPKEQIPLLIKKLVLEDIQVFAIREVSKTLEDRFLELTTDKGVTSRG